MCCKLEQEPTPRVSVCCKLSCWQPLGALRFQMSLKPLGLFHEANRLAQFRCPSCPPKPWKRPVFCGSSLDKLRPNPKNSSPYPICKSGVAIEPTPRSRYPRPWPEKDLICLGDFQGKAKKQSPKGTVGAGLGIPQSREIDSPIRGARWLGGGPGVGSLYPQEPAAQIPPPDAC